MGVCPTSNDQQTARSSPLRRQRGNSSAVPSSGNPSFQQPTIGCTAKRMRTAPSCGVCPPICCPAGFATAYPPAHLNAVLTSPPWSMKLHFKTKTLNLELSTRAANASRKLPRRREKEQASPCSESPWRGLKTAMWWFLGTLMGAVVKHYLETWL